MSFNLEGGLPIAIIEGGPLDGEFVFLDKDDEHGKKIFTIKKGKFVQFGNWLYRIHYKCGPSGVGKSTSCAAYCKGFQRLNPDKPIIILSRLNEDPAFDDIKVKRLKITDDLIRVPLALESIEEGSLIIFDDLDTISDNKLLKCIYNFLRQLLELGRHKKIQVLITSHLINGTDRNLCRTIQNELDSLTIFPQGCNIYQVSMNLQNYWGLTPKQIRKIMNTTSRSVTLFKKHPQYMMTDNTICLLSELTKI